MQVKTTKTSEAEQIEIAKAKLEKLQCAAVDAEAEYKRLEKAYAASRPRSRDLALDKQVAKDELADRREEAERYQREVLDVLEAQKRQAECNVVAVAYAAKVAEAAKAFTTATSTIMAGIAEYDAAIAKLAALQSDRVAAMQLGAAIVHISLDHLVTATHVQFGTLRAEQAGGLYMRDAGARLIQTGQESRICLEFTRPANIVAMPLQ